MASFPRDRTRTAHRRNILGSYQSELSRRTRSLLSAAVIETLESRVVLTATMTSITALPNPSAFGAPVTLTATVASVNPVDGTPTGSVSFMDGTTLLGTATLNGSGVGVFATTAQQLAVGTHPLTAEYPATSTFDASGSAPLSQVVNRVSTTTVLSSSLNPSAFGVPVTFTVTGANPQQFTATTDGSARRSRKTAAFRSPFSIRASIKASHGSGRNASI